MISVYYYVGCVGGDSCCVEGACGENEGDCDADSDCQAGFICGSDNCNGDSFDDTDDCCTAATTGKFILIIDKVFSWETIFIL